MPKPERQLLVCLNTRPPGNPKGACGDKGAKEVHEALKSAVKEQGLGKRVMVQSASCLKHCSQGVTVAVQPDNVWYAKVTLADLPEILREHVIGGKPVERLLMPDIPWE
jgi:(2Fe-2S) ferredoxin